MMITSKSLKRIRAIFLISLMGVFSSLAFAESSIGGITNGDGLQSRIAHSDRSSEANPTETNASSSTNAEVTINTQIQKPVFANFSGFNYDISSGPVPYNNLGFQHIIQSFSPAVLRYPGGTISDTFNWKIGGYDLTPEKTPKWTMNNIFRAYNTNVKGVRDWAKKCEEKAAICMGKGGMPLYESVGLSKNIGDAKIVICVNTITDPPRSAYELAYRVAKEKMPVTVFSLGNECYSIISPTGKPNDLPGLPASGIPPDVPGTFVSGEDYAEKMIPYYDAIKSGYRDAGEDPRNAVVAIIGDSIKMYDIDPKNHFNKSKWDSGLIHFTQTNSRGQYWDAVDLHEYVTRAKTLDESLKRCNSYLMFGTASYISDIWKPSSKPDTKFLFTEYAACNELTGTLYGGLFCAEFAMRLSAEAGVLHAMNHLRRTPDGIDVPEYKAWENKLIGAARSGHVLNVSQVDFHPSVSAQLIVQGVANLALNNSDRLFKTTLSGGPNVPAGFNKTVQIPAIYAQAYHGKNGKNFLLLVNKGAKAASVNIDLDHQTGTLFTVFCVSSTNPAFRATFDASGKILQPSADNLTLVSWKAVKNVVLPGYAVARLEW